MDEEIPPCDVCGRPVEPVWRQPTGLRPGRLTAPAKVLSGYRCTDPGCRRSRGMPIGWPTD